jgi:hypothetical protein
VGDADCADVKMDQDIGSYGYEIQHEKALKGMSVIYIAQSKCFTHLPSEILSLLMVQKTEQPVFLVRSSRGHRL